MTPLANWTLSQWGSRLDARDRTIEAVIEDLLERAPQAAGEAARRALDEAGADGHGAFSGRASALRTIVRRGLSDRASALRNIVRGLEAAIQHEREMH